MDSNLDQQGWWDELSCKEFEAFLDEMDAESRDEEEERRRAEEAYWESRISQHELDRRENPIELGWF